MKRQRKMYERPLRPWDKQRIEREKKLLKEYGLRRKKEIWRAEGLLRKFRRLARELIAKPDEQKEKELIGRLVKLGILNEGATLDDVLSLSVENFLDRRLQTVLYKKNFANTAKQARQMIVHGHVKIKDRKIVYPSYLVTKDEENFISVQLPISAKVVKGAADKTA
jgi:small subunit ribosomal protein S4